MSVRLFSVVVVLQVLSLLPSSVSAKDQRKWEYSNPSFFIEEGSNCSLMTSVDCKVVGGDQDGIDCLDIAPEMPFLTLDASECPMEPISTKVTFEICNTGTSHLIMDEKKTVMRVKERDVTPYSLFDKPLDPGKCFTYSQKQIINGCNLFEKRYKEGDLSMSVSFPFYVRVKAFSVGVSTTFKAAKKQKKQSKCKVSTYRTSTLKIEDAELVCSVKPKAGKRSKSAKSEAPSASPSSSGPPFSDKLLNFKSDYNITLAAVHFSEAVYKYYDDDIEEYMRNENEGNLKEFNVTKFFDMRSGLKNTYDSQAAVGLHNANQLSGNHIFVAFRGSQLPDALDGNKLYGVIQDWLLTDANAVPQPLTFEGEIGPSDLITIHQGFHAALIGSGILNALEDEVTKLLEDKNNSGRVIITGHSLGGALAQIFAAYMAQVYPAVNFELITFGAPKVSYGNGFKSWAESLTNLSMWRLVYDNDAAARFPPDSIGYRSTGHTFQIYPKKEKSRAFYRHYGQGDKYRGVAECWSIIIGPLSPVVGFPLPIPVQAALDHPLKNYIDFLEDDIGVERFSQNEDFKSDYWPRWFQEVKECGTTDYFCKWNVGVDECDSLI